MVEEDPLTRKWDRDIERNMEHGDWADPKEPHYEATSMARGWERRLNAGPD